MIKAYVESGAGLAQENWTGAWTFDLALWGVCGQGADEHAALEDLQRQAGRSMELVVEERIHGDELAFGRDRIPCTDAERQRTLEVLATVRPQNIALVRSLPDEVLDWDDPERTLPTFASWRTIRQVAWHIVDTESRYYLPGCGLGDRAPEGDLIEELAVSHDHVRQVVTDMPADQACGDWTAVKLLRRLAWHEPGELVVMHEIAARYP